MNFRKIFTPALATCAFALATAWAPTASAQVLIDELQGLLETHPQIKAKQKGVAASEEGIRVARSGYLPTVRVNGDTGPEYVDSPTRRMTEGSAFYKGRETAGLTVTQRLFDGYATDSAVDAAKISRDLTGADLRAYRQSTLLEGVQAYVDVLRQTKLIQLARDSERKILEQQNFEDERVQKGSGIASDVLAAKQRLAVAKERRVNYEGAFDAAVARYTQVFGHAPDVARLADPPVPQALIPPQLEEAVRSAETENPTLETAKKTVALTGEQQRTAESGYYPNIDLVGRADYENDKNAVIGVRRDWSVLLTATWELFSGFKTDAQVAQASYNHAASKDQELYANRKVIETVRINWFKLKTARERMSLLENAAVLAEEVWDAQKKREAAGKATVQDVLDEETRINDARINFTSAYYDMIQFSYELLAAMGRLELDGVRQVPPAPGKPGRADADAKARNAMMTPTGTAPRQPEAKLAAAPAPTPAPAPSRAIAPATAIVEPPAPTPVPVDPYIPVNANAFGDDLPDGSPAAMQARMRPLMQASGR